MPADNFSRFFWPRAVAIQLLLLGLWWFVLYQPSLVLLRVTAQIPFGLFTARQDREALEVDPSGEWKFSIPVSPFVRYGPSGEETVSAIEFSAPAANVAPFTTAWFVYLGLALNVPLTRANLRRSLIGLAVQTVVSDLALFGYAKINALGIVTNMHRSPDALSLWLAKLAYHIDYLVVPYASPFLVLLATHPVWWTFLTKGANRTDSVSRAETPAVALPKPGNLKGGNRRNRGLEKPALRALGDGR